MTKDFPQTVPREVPLSNMSGRLIVTAHGAVVFIAERDFQ
jgi:hypothetical protein